MPTIDEALKSGEGNGLRDIGVKPLRRKMKNPVERLVACETAAIRVVPDDLDGKRAPDRRPVQPPRTPERYVPARKGTVSAGTAVAVARDPLERGIKMAATSSSPLPETLNSASPPGSAAA